MSEEWLAYAWVQRHLGQHQNARLIADNLQEQAEAENNQRLQLDVLLLNAALAQDAGYHDATLGSLEQALQRVVRYGGGQSLQLEGRLFNALIRQLLDPQTRCHLGFAQPLPPRDHLPWLSRNLHPGDESPLQPLAETLTRRERDVLLRMARGQSNQQVADGLFISLSTVKTHINNLFRKLDANDRDEALQFARALKLLD